MKSSGNRIPRTYGDDATVHRTFQRWRELGVFEKIWAVLVEECDELGAVNWEWQAADTAWWCYASMAEKSFIFQTNKPAPRILLPG